MKEWARKCILNRKDYIPGKPIEEVQKEFGITDIIKMASNENPLGTSPKAIKAMIEEIQKNSARYPVGLCTQLVEKIASSLCVKPEQVYVDNGGDAVITMFGLAFFNPEDEIITADTTFPAYENITTKMGSKLIKIPLTSGGFYDMDSVFDAITAKTKAVFICNPNNPTGAITPKEKIVSFLKKIPKTILVFLDEAYYDFADDPDYLNSIEILNDFNNLIVLRTFSKVMGLAGIRCGYCVACPEIIKIMMKAREPFPVNRIAQIGALAALDDYEFVEKTLENNAKSRLYYYKEFDKLGLNFFKSQSNFICVDINANAEEVFQKMLRDGVIVRPLNFQGMPKCLRITFGLPNENERTIQSLKRALGKN
ncbi:MAG: histidinol-phosphate transaminase [Sphaerochaetaceae bacterium]